MEQITNNNNDKRIAFVLGNGRTRHRFDISMLQSIGTVYGCNRIYTDIMPDYLISVDKAMVDILLQDHVETNTKVYIDHRLPYNNKHLHKFDCNVTGICDSGNMACMLAAEHDHDIVYMIGFDYISQDGYHNNVYAGTRPYKDRQDVHTLPISVENWYQKARIVYERYTDTRFVRVNSNDFVPDFVYDNYTNITPTEFDQIIPNVFDPTIIVPQHYRQDNTKLVHRHRNQRVYENNAILTRGMIKWAK